MRHVILTGEIGAGKSTVLAQTLRLLHVQAEGIQTGAYEPREAQEKTLYMRAYGDNAKGCPFARVPGGDKAYAARCFNAVGVYLLRRATIRGELIVIDEMGYLERDAEAYQKELRMTLDADVPVLAVLRQNKTEWADWIRNRADIALMMVTPQNRNGLPKLAEDILRRQIKRKDQKGFPMDETICYELHEHEKGLFMPIENRFR